MKWDQLFSINQIPSNEEIKQYIEEAEPIWEELIDYIEEAYRVQPQMAYSKCSAQPGWNVKYKKSGKSLCTLYPMQGFFIALVVIGVKEQEDVEMGLETLSPYVQALYRKTSFSAGGRWLMIEVKDKSVANDIKTLMSIRVKPRR